MCCSISLGVLVAFSHWSQWNLCPWTCTWHELTCLCLFHRGKTCTAGTDCSFMRSLMILKLLPSSLWNSTLRTVRTSLLVTVHVSHMLHQTFYWFQRYRTFVTYNLLAWTWQNKVLHTSTIVGSFLLVMGMIMTFCLLSYPWSSLSKLSLSPSIYLSINLSIWKPMFGYYLFKT